MTQSGFKNTYIAHRNLTQENVPLSKQTKRKTFSKYDPHLLPLHLLSGKKNEFPIIHFYLYLFFLIYPLTLSVFIDLCDF